MANKKIISAGKALENRLYCGLRDDLGADVQLARESLRLSQSELSALLGRSQSWIGDIERGKSWPPIWLTAILGTTGVLRGYRVRKAKKNRKPLFDLLAAGLQPMPARAMRLERSAAMFLQIAGRVTDQLEEELVEEIRRGLPPEPRGAGEDPTWLSILAVDGGSLVVDGPAVKESLGDAWPRVQSAIADAATTGRTVYEMAGGAVHAYAHRGGTSPECGPGCRDKWLSFLDLGP